MQQSFQPNDLLSNQMSCSSYLCIGDLILRSFHYSFRMFMNLYSGVFSGVFVLWQLVFLKNCGSADENVQQGPSSDVLFTGCWAFTGYVCVHVRRGTVFTGFPALQSSTVVQLQLSLCWICPYLCMHAARTDLMSENVCELADVGCGFWSIRVQSDLVILCVPSFVLSTVWEENRIWVGYLEQIVYKWLAMHKVGFNSYSSTVYAFIYRHNKFRSLNGLSFFLFL